MSIVGNSYFDDIAPATKYKIENSDITEDHNHYTVLPQKIKMGPIDVRESTYNDPGMTTVMHSENTNMHDPIIYIYKLSV
jgi:hypothetical protein